VSSFLFLSKTHDKSSAQHACFLPDGRKREKVQRTSKAGRILVDNILLHRCSGVVGFGPGVVQLAGLGVLAGSLGVQGGGSLTVESLEHLQESCLSSPQALTPVPNAAAYIITHGILSVGQ
jgi:hypothetical protein